MKKLLIYHLIVLFTITACNNNNINDYSYSPQANSPKSNHQLSNTEIYKVKLDSTIISSKYGFFADILEDLDCPYKVPRTVLFV